LHFLGFKGFLKIELKRLMIDFNLWLRVISKPRSKMLNLEANALLSYN
jgi:hypothetical protein